MNDHRLPDDVRQEYKDVRKLTDGLPDERRYAFAVTKTDGDGKVSLVHIFADGTRCFDYDEVVDYVLAFEEG